MMNSQSVLIVAEIGSKVGWGHLARANLLRKTLSAHTRVTLKVVNREKWADSALEDEYALHQPIEADVVFFDGLALKKEADLFVRADLRISLSYISDMNNEVDLVVAPSLHGMNAPKHFITELSSMLCNVPSPEHLADNDDHIEYHKRLIGVCMGGGDVDGVTPAICHELNEHGFQTQVYPSPFKRKLTLNEFLGRKLRDQEGNSFPYSDLKSCSSVICQGGLSAVEFALMGMPTVVRRRSDFTEAYQFLNKQGCSLKPKENTIPSLIEAVNVISENQQLRQRMSNAGKSLNAIVDETFWLSLINRQRENNYEHLSLLPKYRFKSLDRKLLSL